MHIKTKQRIRREILSDIKFEQELLQNFEELDIRKILEQNIARLLAKLNKLREGRYGEAEIKKELSRFSTGERLPD